MSVSRTDGIDEIGGAIGLAVFASPGCLQRVKTDGPSIGTHRSITAVFRKNRQDVIENDPDRPFDRGGVFVWAQVVGGLA